jgi:hypothetical protein
MSPQEVAAKYETVINWENIGGSQGLTSAQVSVFCGHAAHVQPLHEAHGMAAGQGRACSFLLSHQQLAAAAQTHCLLCCPPCKTHLQVAERIKRDGLNRLTPPKETPEIIKFLKQFTNPLMALLVVAGALTYMAYGIQSPRDSNNLILASALIIVVTLTCVMSYWQERSAGNVMGEWALMDCTQAQDRQQQPSRTCHTYKQHDGRATACYPADIGSWCGFCVGALSPCWAPGGGQRRGQGNDHCSAPASLADQLPPRAPPLQVHTPANVSAACSHGSKCMLAGSGLLAVVCPLHAGAAKQPNAGSPVMSPVVCAASSLAWGASHRTC